MIPIKKITINASKLNYLASISKYSRKKNKKKDKNKKRKKKENNGRNDEIKTA